MSDYFPSKSEKESSADLLEMFPVRMVRWKTDSQGRVVLLKPKFKGSWMKKYVLSRMKRPYYKVKLDDKGSFIWKHSDGSRNVRELAEMHKKKFGKDAEPLLERLALFLHTLDKNGFIEYRTG